MGRMQARGQSRHFGVGFHLALIAGLFAAIDAGAAVMCRLHLGAGCNGPTVYEIQLCAVVTFNQSRCERLCQNVKPLCNMTDFDKWVSAYHEKGRHGFRGELAETSASDHYDDAGQLVATAGNVYTVCASGKTDPLAGWSPEFPLTMPPAACPTVVLPSAANCRAGTVFNNDPINPRCVTGNSYCDGAGSSGNFVNTVSGGFTVVAVQNQHFVGAPTPDSNVTQSAVTGGSILPGLTDPVTSPVAGSPAAGSFTSMNSARRGGPAASIAKGAGGSAATPGSNSASSLAATEAGGPHLASKTGALIAEENGGSVGGAGEKASGVESGLSWFSAGATATAGGAAGELGIDPAGAVGRGLASDGTLRIDDPANYFMLSDVEVSLFKRITAQCRKRERSLVLAP